MKIISKQIIVFTVILITSFLFAANSQAVPRIACTDSAAPWNATRNKSVFSCQALDQKEGGCNATANDDYTIIHPDRLLVLPKVGACAKGTCCAYHVKCSRAGIVKGSEWKCMNQNKTPYLGNESDYQCEAWYCYGLGNIKCCKKKVKPKPVVKIVYPPPPPAPPPVVVHLDDCCGQILPERPASGYQLNHMVQTAINIYECILCIVAALIFIMLVIGGVILMISGGNVDKVSLGKKIIIGAVIGGVIAFSTYLIIYWTITALGAGTSGGSSTLIINPGS